MIAPASFDSSRYLTAKGTVDDRALNRRIWHRFLDELTQIYEERGEVRLLEVGGGIGVTVKRLASALRHMPIETLSYTFVELSSEHVATARQRLAEWGPEIGYNVLCSGDKIEFTSEWASFDVQLIEGDAFRLFEDGGNGPSFNAVIAQAWLDIVNIEQALKGINRITSADGLLYLPIHFDGVTTFLPSFDTELDRSIERLYHRSMDQSTPHGRAGGSKTGRKLLEVLPAFNFIHTTAGSSDWIVLPQDDGSYPADEAYFLHHILQFVEEELSGSDQISTYQLNSWLSHRRAQIEAGELVYIAHQLDILARAS